jgi:hypothetical protein
MDEKVEVEKTREFYKGPAGDFLALGVCVEVDAPHMGDAVCGMCVDLDE